MPNAPKKRAQVGVIAALRKGLEAIRKARANQGVSPEAALTGQQHVYFDSWVIPYLEAALRAAEGGEDVPYWMKRR